VQFHTKKSIGRYRTGKVITCQRQLDHSVASSSRRRQSRSIFHSTDITSLQTVSTLSGIIFPTPLPISALPICFHIFSSASLGYILSLILLRNDWRRLLDLASEDVTLDEVWQPDCELVMNELASWDGEDLCKVISAYGRAKTSAFNLRSISSRVSCLVSRTKQKIMNQASRLRPA
jgi:hypothetical protein